MSLLLNRYFLGFSTFYKEQLAKNRQHSWKVKGVGGRTCPPPPYKRLDFNFGSTSSLSLDASPLNLVSC